ncbi:MAG: hypothetical protein AAF587_11790 [Bacteroidota bacterium]
MGYSFKLLLQKNLLRIRTVSITLLDMLLYVILPAPRLDTSSSTDKKVILFLGDSLQARIPRLAKWLNRTGEFDCMLMVARGKGFSIFDTETFSKTFTFRSRWDLRRQLKGLEQVYVIHAFTMPSYQIRLAIEKTDLPVIMDIQDMHVSYFGLNSPKLYMRLDMPDESYSISHSDGIVSHSIELYNACQEYQITNRPPTLMFPVYCDDDHLLTPASIPSMDEIHIVYAGSIAGSFQDDQHFGSLKFFRVIEAFSKQKVHLHIYPSPTMRFRDLILSEYQAISDENPYFHLHESVPQKELAEALTTYHFGLLPFFLEDTSRSANKLGRGSSQKLYNYIESGIPVIISEDLAFQSWMAQRYGAGLEITKPDLLQIRELIEKIAYADMREELLEKRAKISLSTHIPRLTAFYHRIHEKALQNQQIGTNA